MRLLVEEITLRKEWKCLLLLLLTACCLAGCSDIRKDVPEIGQPALLATEAVETKTTEAAEEAENNPLFAPEITEESLPSDSIPEPAHSPLYIPGLSVEDVIIYFNEVCLDAEFVNSGNASLLQKWTAPICYSVNGEPTPEDRAVLDSFAGWLNSVEGFPGISEAEEPFMANLQIYFCGQEELHTRMGENFADVDGAVTFWYLENVIYDAIICIRTDLDQEVRNSVILEELYNGLGPVQDTSVRMDSIIFSGYSAPQNLTPVDELILKLLYHPQLACGMNAGECEAVIRQLYY